VAGDYPGINAGLGALRRFFLDRPPADLTSAELVSETGHWEKELETLERASQSNAPDPIADGARKGGILVSVVSIPVAFLSWPIGLPVALVGAAATGIGEWRRRRASKRDHYHERCVEALEDRLQLVRTEINRRVLAHQP
jgi:hypothetical protein